MITPLPLSAQKGHLFFGYYGVSPWNRAMTRHLVLRTDFADRLPHPDESAEIGFVEAGDYQPFARTAAFNFQQGAMLHWIDVGFGEEVIFNDWSCGRVVSTAIDVQSGRRRTLDCGIADVCQTRRLGLGLDFARNWHCRPIVGYANENPDRARSAVPHDDGLHLIDLATGHASLRLSLADILHDSSSPWRFADVRCAWIDHAYFSPGGDDIVFFVRARVEGKRQTAVYQLNCDMKSPQLILPPRGRPAHMAWLDDHRFILACRVHDHDGFHLFTRGANQPQRFGDLNMPVDGHPSFSPDRQWLVTDTLPTGDDMTRELMMIHVATGRKISLGHYPSASPFRGDVRCDLHPRWRPDGGMISFDSSHEGRRMVYVVDVQQIVGG